MTPLHTQRPLLPEDLNQPLGEAGAGHRKGLSVFNLSSRGCRSSRRATSRPWTFWVQLLKAGAALAVVLKYLNSPAMPHMLPLTADESQTKGQTIVGTFCLGLYYNIVREWITQRNGSQHELFSSAWQPLSNTGKATVIPLYYFYYRPFLIIIKNPLSLLFLN